MIMTPFEKLRDQFYFKMLLVFGMTFGGIALAGIILLILVLLGVQI